MRNELSRQEFMDSSDWEYIFQNFISPTPVLGYEGLTGPFSREDVADIVALVEGENDGPDWVAVFRLNDGRFASVSAGCDYAGWGCQERGRAEVGGSLGDILRYGLTDDERQRLDVQLEN